MSKRIAKRNKHKRGIGSLPTAISRQISQTMLQHVIMSGSNNNAMFHLGSCSVQRRDSLCIHYDQLFPHDG